MRVIYIADDGRQFTNKDACQEYENSLKRTILFTVSQPGNSYNCYTVKEDDNHTLYIEHWDGDYREGGCTFNGTLKEFLRKLL